MKKLLAILSLFITTKTVVKSQVFVPDKLIVSAEQLRFRAKPQTNSKILDVFSNGELLKLLEWNTDNDSEFGYYDKLENDWLKVKRLNTNQTGYVFGRYVKPVNIAYIESQDCNSIPMLNWYGLNEIKGDVFLRETNPWIKNKPEMPAIIDSFSLILIGSYKKLNQRKINGNLYVNKTHFVINQGESKIIYSVNNLHYKLYVCNDIEQIKDRILNVEKLFLIVENSKGDTMILNELTNQFKHIGNMGFQVHFVGELNEDNFPDLIISGVSEKNTPVYYFLSKDDRLKLQSITWQGSGC